MNCETVQRDLPLFLYGELSLEEEQALQDHVEACAACRRALEGERLLHAALEARALEPSPELLAACRRRLSLSLQAAERPAGRMARTAAWLGIRAGWRALLARTAAAAALVALGFFGARWSRGPSGLPAAEGPAESQAARIRFLEPDPAGRVRIALEEVRRQVITGRPEEDRIQRLLLAASREAADPGLRVESLELLRGGAGQPAVRRALLEALEHDPNPGVRLKALEALRPFAAQAEVRQALARVLLADANPGLRVQAIDLLTQQGGREAFIGVLQELLNREENSYVRLRCRRALEELNASVGTF